MTQCNKRGNKYRQTKLTTTELEHINSEISYYEKANGFIPHPAQSELAAHLLGSLEFDAPFTKLISEIPRLMCNLVRLGQLQNFPEDPQSLLRRLETLQELHSFFLRCYTSSVLPKQR